MVLIRVRAPSSRGFLLVGLCRDRASTSRAFEGAAVACPVTRSAGCGHRIAALPVLRRARPDRRASSSKTSSVAWPVHRSVLTGRHLQGCPKNAPPSVVSREVLSRRRSLASPLRALPSSEGCRPPSVPPSWSFPTLTVCSLTGLRACCIPLPTLGFTGFSRRGAASHLRCVLTGATALQSASTRTAVPPSPATVAPSPLQAASPLRGPARPRGLAPCARPWRRHPLPDPAARGSPGLPRT